MIKNLFSFGQGSALKHMDKVIKEINKQGLDLNETTNYAEETIALKNKISSGKLTLEDALPRAFAVCRAASEFSMGMRHYDVQIQGAIALHKGSIAEMNTGEGKTLVATLSSYLNALSGDQVHIVTVNEYLANRDAEIVRPLFERLGLSVGALRSDMSHEEKVLAYSCDILYATSNDLAFDYLRDNIANSPEDVLQKKLSFAIVDEVDSILIDEARTPLVLSGEGELEENEIEFMKSILPDFSIHWLDEKKDKEGNVKENIILDEKNKVARLTESGFRKLEEELKKSGIINSESDLYVIENLFYVNMFSTSARAYYLYKNQVDYLVDEGQVKIINQSTGRLEEGKRWSEGLHQAVESKEGVDIKPETQTLGSVSLQNFFRMYDKLSGMSGTAYSEHEEFGEVYGMGVVRVPTHKKSLRKDHADIVYLTEIEKIRAIIKDIKSKQELGRPVLVGTSSVEESDMISRELDVIGLSHQVLNAKQHGKEAEIIAQAGRPGTVTIATNMAGRGTDIILGGSLNNWIEGINADDKSAIKILTAHWKASNTQVKKSGGLHVIGTTRNESRRIDNQLIGRAGRQGDPGSSIFYSSLDDKILRLFNGSRYKSFFRKMGIEENEGITHSMLNKAIMKSQEQMTEQGSSVRKELLKYDDIVNMQRQSIYSMRRDWLFNENDINNVTEIILSGLNGIIESYIPHGNFMETWNSDGLEDILNSGWGLNIPVSEMIADNKFNEDNIHNEIKKRVILEIKSWNDFDITILNSVFVSLMLFHIDRNWREHLETLDQLREGINLRSYAQKNPLQEYGKDALLFFTSMIKAIQVDFITGVFNSMKEIRLHQNLELSEIKLDEVKYMADN
jgi:preprotein translocase subunit SecA